MNYRNMTNSELIREAESINHPLFHEFAKRLLEMPDESLDINELAKLADVVGEHGVDAILADYRDAYLELGDFLADDWFNIWQADRDAEIGLTDPERAERMNEAAEHGEDGSTHGERIKDMYRAVRDARYMNEIGPLTLIRLDKEIDAVYEWFENRGKLDRQVG